jgi:hypothetical protein
MDVNENDILKLHSQGYTNTIICNKLSITKHHLTKVLKKHGKKRNSVSDMVDHEPILKLNDRGYHINKISKELNINGKLILRILKQHGKTRNRIVPKEEYRYGNRIVKNKRTIKIVPGLNQKERTSMIKDQDVVEFYRNNNNTYETALKFNCSISHIRKILKRNDVKRNKIRYTDEEIINEYKKLGKLVDVVKSFKISEYYVNKVLKRNNIQLIYLKRYDVGNVYSNLTLIDRDKSKNDLLTFKCGLCGGIKTITRKKFNKNRHTDCGCTKLKEREEKKRLKEEKRIKREKEIEERRRLREIKLKNRKPRKIVTYIGAVKGRLTITDIKGTYPNKIVIAKCECGTIKEYKNSLNSQSCGCLQKERSQTHGMVSKDRKGYDRWKSMISRCHNPKSKAYHNYGGRGIYVCDRWRLPNGEGCNNYLKDIKEHLGPKPKGNYSLDRINNDGPYEISNLRWADASTQTKNQRKHKKNKNQTKIDFSV